LERHTIGGLKLNIVRQRDQRPVHVFAVLATEQFRVGEKAQEADYFPAIVRPKAAEIGPVIQETFAKAYDAGVKIAFGTDTGVSPHGENAREFELMVEAGMPPMEAIQSATMGGAALLRVEDELGSVTQGKIADLVAVPGNPLDNISLMKEVSFVMKAGTVYKTPDAM